MPRLVIVWLLSLCSLVAWGAQPVPRIRAALEKHSLRGARCGVVVRRLSDGVEVFSLRGTELFHIASNTKLFTTAAALWRLGPEYRFRTAVIANGKVEEGVLNGDLVIVGGGDPSLSGRFHGDDIMHVPRQIAAAVQRFGIREISGDLVMDDRLFDRTLRPKAWPKGEGLWWYAAPISALSFNDNCVTIKVTGDSVVGRPVKVSISPDISYVRVVNRCKTVPKDARHGVTLERGENGAIVVGGTLRSGKSRSDFITVQNPPLFLAASIRGQMSKQGISVAGRDRLVRENETAGPEARELFVWHSSLNGAVVVANKRSQNFYAEQILKTLGAVSTGVGTFESGLNVVREFLETAHIPAETVRLADGCGLSPGNQATPQAVAALLEVMYRTEFHEVFFNSLAVNGDAGTTLKNRMTEPAMLGRLHAKTGTIKSRGLSALSGYARSLDGEAYAFSILTNGYDPGQLQRVRQLENSLCRALVGVPAPADTADRRKKKK